MPPSIAPGSSIMKLKGDEHIILAISVGHVTRTSILQFAGVLSPQRNMNSYTGPQYAEKKKLWQIDEQGVYSLTQDGNDALHYLLEANPCIGEDAERCSQKAIEEGAVAATDSPAGKPSVGDEPSVDAWPTPTADGAPRSAHALPAATTSRALELRSRKRSIPGGGSSALVPEPIGVAAMDKRLDEALSAIDACAEMRAWFGREHAKLGASSAASVEATFELASRYAEKKASVEKLCEEKRAELRAARETLHATSAAAQEVIANVRRKHPSSVPPDSMSISWQLVQAIARIDVRTILKDWVQAEHPKIQSGGVEEFMELAERYCQTKETVKEELHSTLALLRTARDELQNAFDACDGAIYDAAPGAGAGAGGGGSSPSKRAKGSHS
jgi:hypothetical protein